MAGFGVSGVEPSASAAIVLVFGNSWRFIIIIIIIIVVVVVIII
jgi:hypothetical protein